MNQETNEQWNAEWNEDKPTEFEAALQRALRPVAPPATLAKFLAAAAEAHEQQRRTGRCWLRPRSRSGSWGLLYVTPWPRVWAGGALAALLLAGALFGEQAHRRHQREAADAEFATSMRITDEALARTRAQLLQAGVRLEE
jgi:hypothetical protein